MDSSSLPGRVSWVENINWNLTVSPVYVINIGGVTMSLFGYISVCYVKPLEWAAGVEVSDLFHIFLSVGGVPQKPDVLRPKDFKLWSQIRLINP